jgi:predicted transcriptional regulator
LNTQNVTITLKKDLLRKAKILAIERETSLSGLLAQTLEKLVAKEDAYDSAYRHHTALLERGFDLGTKGRISVTREVLHDR